MGPVLMGGNCERGKVPSPWELPSPAERSAGIERELHGLRGERSSWIAAGRTERREKDQHRGTWPLPCTPQPKTHVCWCARGVGTGTWASVGRPGERTGVAYAETT